MSRFSKIIRHTWPLLSFALLGAIGIFWSVSSELEGRFTAEIIMMILAGALSGSLIRLFIREKRVGYVFVLVVATESILLAMGPPPWSGLWVVLIPTSAMGLMIGNAIRIGMATTRPKPRKNIWTVNGVEEQNAAVAESKVMDQLTAWNSEASGVFVVAYGNSQFEAAGNSKAGFIVHCTNNIQIEENWRVLGDIGSAGEIELPLHFGQALIPAGMITDMQTVRQALGGFFRHLGPAPDLEWTSGGETTDLRFLGYVGEQKI